MRTFKEYFEQQETAADTIALLPGGFKPPTKGHFQALKYLLDDADRGVVVIGRKERDGITADQAKAVWEIYSKYLNKPIDITVADVTPVRSVYEFAENNKESNIIVGAGDKDEDMKRYDYFSKNIDKYPLVNVIKIPLQSEGISGTATRELINTDIDKAVKYFTPEGISDVHVRDIKEVLDHPGRGLPEEDAEYRGRKVTLNKPTRGDVKKFKVYVKDPKTGNIRKVNFGHGGTSAKRRGEKTMKIRKSNPKARKSFRARHNCDNPGSKLKARYWSCKKW